MNKADKDNKCCILIADDDEDDQMMMTTAFEDIGFTGVINIVSNGEQVIEYLQKLGEYADKEDPSIIMLDLNMPKKDGRYALKEIRKHPKFSKVPVIVYSTSNNPEDISNCYALGANSFISKPSSYQDLKNIAEMIQNYWLKMVLLPSSES